jgi:ABC-type multidrug transport system ATPase subunit
VIIDHGRAIAAGTPDELKSQAGHDVLEVRPRAAGDLPAVEDILRSVADEAPRLDLDTSTAAIATDRGADELTAAIRLLGERHIAIDDIGLRRPSLDEVFLALTGRHAKSVPADEADPALDAARP